MCEFEHKFIFGLLKANDSRKILEIGIASGETRKYLDVTGQNYNGEYV